MQNFIVLGYVPGTNIQITFGTWLLCIAMVSTLSFLFHARFYFKAWLLSFYVSYLIKRRQLA